MAMLLRPALVALVALVAPGAQVAAQAVQVVPVVVAVLAVATRVVKAALLAAVSARKATADGAARFGAESAVALRRSVVEWAAVRALLAKLLRLAFRRAWALPQRVLAWLAWLP